jgi:hypothetical protein
MKPGGCRTFALTMALVGCCSAVALATRPDRTLEIELGTLVGIVTQVTERGFQDEEGFFSALVEMGPDHGERGRPSLLRRLDAGFQRRFYFGPPVSQGSPGARRRAFAVTASGAWGRKIAFCADTTPRVCTRRDGFTPRVRAGKCDDPRCEPW